MVIFIAVVQYVVVIPSIIGLTGQFRKCQFEPRLVPDPARCRRIERKSDPRSFQMSLRPVLHFVRRLCVKYPRCYVVVSTTHLMSSALSTVAISIKLKQHQPVQCSQCSATQCSLVEPARFTVVPDSWWCEDIAQRFVHRSRG